jgi:hypothetical protein
MRNVNSPPPGWTAAPIPFVEAKGDMIRIECECSVCRGAGIWRERHAPSIGITCTNCRGGGRCIVYLTAWTGRKRLDDIVTVRASEYVPEMAY